MTGYLEILKTIGMGLSLLALFAILCGVSAIFLTKYFPNWTFNELVFPPKKEVKDA